MDEVKGVEDKEVVDVKEEVVVTLGFGSAGTPSAPRMERASKGSNEMRECILYVFFISFAKPDGF